MLKRKSSATVSSLVPSGSLTTSWLPSTAMTSNDLTSVELVVVCASDTAAVENTTAAARTIRTIARVITLSVSVLHALGEPSTRREKT